MTVALCTGKFGATGFTLGTSVDVASGELISARILRNPAKS
jgi:hypothetical protein